MPISTFKFLTLPPVPKELGEELIKFFTKIEDEHNLNLGPTIAQIKQGLEAEDFMKAIDPVYRCIIRAREINSVARIVESGNTEELFKVAKDGSVKVKNLATRAWSTALIPNDEATGYMRARIEMCGWDATDEQDAKFDELVERGEIDPSRLFLTGKRLTTPKVVSAKAAIKAAKVTTKAAIGNATGDKNTGEKKRKADIMERSGDESDDETISEASDDDDAGANENEKAKKLEAFDHAMARAMATAT